MGEFVPSRLFVFIGSTSPPPHHSIKESPTCSGNWLEKGNELSTRAPQSTGQGLPGQGLCPGFRRALKGRRARSAECRASPAIPPSD